MDLSWRFDFWFNGLPESPRDAGSVRRLVMRPSVGPGVEPGAREVPESIRVTPEAGVVGDLWGDDPEESPLDAQVSLINVHVIDSLAGGDATRAVQSGDNLHVDLDLSEANLPTGSRLSIGTAVLEVTPLPHRPCGQFVERFGSTGAKKVARALRTGHRGRGVLTRVVQAGEIHVGDEIRVERPV